jgi:PhnB protein
MRLNTYLHFNGDCKEAFEFYANTLNGKVVFAMTKGQSPEAVRFPVERHDDVMHARVEIAGQSLIGMDADTRYKAPQGFGVLLTLETPSEAERVFRVLADEGKVTMALGETFWALRFGMLTDKFGVPWMISCDKRMAAAA